MSAFRPSERRGAEAPRASTQSLITAITSSHSPSRVVNIELVSFGRPDARTIRTASATASPTEASPPPLGAMEKATSMWLTVCGAIRRRGAASTNRPEGSRSAVVGIADL